MNDKIKRFAFYNLFFLYFTFSLFMVLNLKSFASSRSYTVYGRSGYPGTGSIYSDYEIVCTFSDEYRYCIYIEHTGDSNGIPNYTTHFLSTGRGTYPVHRYNTSYYSNGNYYSGGEVQTDITFRSNEKGYFESVFYIGNNSFGGDLPIFYNLSEAESYILYGVLPNAFDQNLKLDSFKVTSWQIGTSQLIFRSKFEVKWSDSRISNVQVRIVGTANSPVSFEANQSPFKQKFYASDYVMKNGDVIHFTATPYTSNGQYGESLYYSLIYNDNIPSNWYRKLVNTPYNDNTIDIPYNNVSGQPQSVTLPVDGITTNKVYKVNYNPVTYEYGDLNIYDIYYSPVIVMPDNLPSDEEEEIEDSIINNYTTNNYNTINNNTNYDFEINFGDISNNDIQNSYDDVGGFINGFGSFIAKIVTFFGVLFPFFPTGVSIAIITAFGIVALLLIVALANKYPRKKRKSFCHQHSQVSYFGYKIKKFIK